MILELILRLPFKRDNAETGHSLEKVTPRIRQKAELLISNQHRNRRRTQSSYDESDTCNMYFLDKLLTPCP